MLDQAESLRKLINNEEEQHKKISTKIITVTSGKVELEKVILLLI